MNINTIYAPLLRGFRVKRMARFTEAMQPTLGTTILDVGGTATNWDLAKLECRITLLNKLGVILQGAGQYDVAEGDGRDLKYPDGRFDIGHSNSVIEHVGTIHDQREFASEIRRVANGLWVQTPARSFWFEPHYLTPFFHWLSPRLRRRLARNFTVWGWITRPTRAQVDARVEEIRLLNYEEFQLLFPDCEIRRERFLGWTKSFVAVREMVEPTERRKS